MLKVSGSKLFQNFRVDLADFVGSCVVTFWYKAAATLCDESLYWRTRRCFVSLQVSLEKLFERQVWKKWWQRTSEAVKHWLSAVFNQTLQQMLIGVLFSRWIFWARSGASIKYGTITAFSQKQIHLSHQTTHLYNFFTQKNIFNFNKHADQWIYQLLCYNFCHKPVQSRDRQQSTSVHCRVKLLSVYGGSVLPPAGSKNDGKAINLQEL